MPVNSADTGMSRTKKFPPPPRSFDIFSAGRGDLGLSQKMNRIVSESDK